MFAEFITEVVVLTNIERANEGLQPLTLNSQLSATAQGHSEDMAVNDFFSHTGLDGDRLGDRAEQNNYDYRALGENIAAGQRTPAQVVQAWINSPGHRENILNPNFTEIGIGYEFLANDRGEVNFNHYWTQVFGRPAVTSANNANNNSVSIDNNVDVAAANESESNAPATNVSESSDFSSAELSGNADTSEGLNSPIFRLQNRDQPGNYLYVGESERNSIRQNNPNFQEEGFAFNVGAEANDGLVGMYRFQNLSRPGTYLFVGEAERNSINQNFSDTFVEEGLAFNVIEAGSGIGESIYRLQNTNQPGTYLFVDQTELSSIQQSFSNFVNEGVAFEI